MPPKKEEKKSKKQLKKEEEERKRLEEEQRVAEEERQRQEQLRLENEKKAAIADLLKNAKEPRSHASQQSLMVEATSNTIEAVLKRDFDKESWERFLSCSEGPYNLLSEKTVNDFLALWLVEFQDALSSNDTPKVLACLGLAEEVTGQLNSKLQFLQSFGISRLDKSLSGLISRLLHMVLSGVDDLTLRLIGDRTQENHEFSTSVTKTQILLNTKQRQYQDSVGFLDGKIQVSLPPAVKDKMVAIRVVQLDCPATKVLFPTCTQDGPVYFVDCFTLPSRTVNKPPFKITRIEPLIGCLSGADLISIKLNGTKLSDEVVACDGSDGVQNVEKTAEFIKFSLSPQTCFSVIGECSGNITGWTVAPTEGMSVLLTMKHSVQGDIAVEVSPAGCLLKTGEGKGKLMGSSELDSHFRRQGVALGPSGIHDDIRTAIGHCPFGVGISYDIDTDNPKNATIHFTVSERSFTIRQESEYRYGEDDVIYLVHAHDGSPSSPTFAPHMTPFGTVYAAMISKLQDKKDSLQPKPPLLINTIKALLQ